MAEQIKIERAKWARALGDNNVGEACRCAHRVRKLTRIQNLLRKANATLAPVLKGVA
jgi:hypothetical protein